VVAAKRDTAELTCCTRITGKEYFFKGHFPGNPVLPGVIITEAMAQASILLYAFLRPESAARNPQYYLGKVEARFMNAVRPGSDLMLQVHGEKIIESGGIVRAIAKVGQTAVAEATLMFGVKQTHE
jgi:3-hydroxyacyl-[acyl-carrier-protein] dehydratase